MKRNHEIGAVELGRLEIGLDELHLALEVEPRRHSPCGRDHIPATVDAIYLDIGEPHDLRKVKIQGEREIRLAAAAIHHDERPLLVGDFHRFAHRLQKLVDLVVLAAHRSADAAFAVGDTEHPQQGGRIERVERHVLDAVVGL